MSEKRTWSTVWANRALDPSQGSILAQLLAADGFDSGFGAVTEGAWAAFAGRWAERFGLGPGDSVYDVGCGSGAFLWPLAEAGLRVGGIDRSESLVRIARSVLAGGEFSVGEAVEMADGEPFDVVLSMGVFLYFPSLDYAAEVIARMAARARRGVAVLDLPDAATRDEALAFRMSSAGGEEAYRARYQGLDHLFFDRGWVSGQLERLGFEAVTADQDLEGYANGPFRFNAWGRRRGG
jgi:SAM-dependent methyltransferase